MILKRIDATGAAIPADGAPSPYVRGYEDGSASFMRPRKPPLLTDSPDYAHTAGVVSRVICPGPCVLLWATGFITGSVGYMWILDAIALPAPAAVLPTNALPMYVPSNGTFRLSREDLSDQGLYFATGLTVAWSTTYATYTAPGSPATMFSAWRWRS